MSGGHNAPRAPRVRKEPNLIPTTVSDSSAASLTTYINRITELCPHLPASVPEGTPDSNPGTINGKIYRVVNWSEECRKFEQSKKVDDVYPPPTHTCSQNKQDQDPEGAGEAWGFELEIEERLTPCPELRTLHAAYYSYNECLGNGYIRDIEIYRSRCAPSRSRFHWARRGRRGRARSTTTAGAGCWRRTYIGVGVGVAENGVGDIDVGGAGAGAGEITHTSSTVSLFPPLPFSLLEVVLKTVVLPIGFGFVFWPYPLAKEEGDLTEGKCIYRLTPAARANVNVFGDATPGKRWAPPPTPTSTATRAGGGCQPVYRPGPAIRAEAERVDADASAGLGSGRGEDGKLHFSSPSCSSPQLSDTEDREEVGDGEEGEDGTQDTVHASHASSSSSSHSEEETSEGTPCVSAGKRLCGEEEAGEGESRAASRSLELELEQAAGKKKKTRQSRRKGREKRDHVPKFESHECCEEEGHGVPNGAYAVQSPLQGVLSASVGRGVLGGARVLEGDGRKSEAGERYDAQAEAGVTASVYEWEYAEEVTIGGGGGGGGARVGMLAWTAGLRRTEGVGIIADSRRSVRGEGRAADMGNDSQKGEAGKDGGSGGARVMKLPAWHSYEEELKGRAEVEATGYCGGGTGDTTRLTIASGLMVLHRITACPLSSAATSWLSAVGEGVGVVGSPLDTGLAERELLPSDSLEGESQRGRGGDGRGHS
ncbi:hypothetical protein B0H14DRAFT_3140375 [Mycena olivaceomarginata]|nr:hypothetical protein B0H14DRAFT_3140375 [Mycena olivaceomarginata]